MGIKRGGWNTEKVNKLATIKGAGQYGARPAAIIQPGLSNSEAYLQKRGNAEPVISKEVSEYRQEELRRGSERGDGKFNLSPLLVKGGSSLERQFGLQKVGAVNTFSGSLGQGAGGTVTMGPEVYSPLFQMANLMLPRDRITMNAWNRNFYDTHPLVHNCINLHATYPISKLTIKCKDRKIEDFFNEMIQDLDLMNILQLMSLEIWSIGEIFAYTDLDETRGVWKDIYVQNPDYMHVKKSVLGGQPIISMRPDAALQRLVQSNHPSDIQLRNQISEEVLYHVRKGNNIPLDNFHISHLKMLSRAYDIHGTSLIVSIYKDLMLYDLLREAKFAQASSLINPITLVKVGGAGDGGEYKPSPEDLEKWRQTFEAAEYDRNFKIISHAAVEIQRIGAAGQIIDIGPDMAFILDNIMYGLMVPKAILTQDGAGFNSASIGLEVLKQRYESFRNLMSQWLIRKVFAPISEIQEFYEYRDGVKKLLVPEIEWNKMVLFDMDNYINVLNGLAEKKGVSKRTLYHSLGLNYETEQRMIKEETIKEVIAEKEGAILKSMTLGALRALKSDEDLIEPSPEDGQEIPGTAGTMGEESGALPGVDLSGGMPSGGGMPDLSTPPPAITAPPTGPTGGAGGLGEAPTVSTSTPATPATPPPAPATPGKT